MPKNGLGTGSSSFVGSHPPLAAANYALSRHRRIDLIDDRSSGRSCRKTDISPVAYDVADRDGHRPGQFARRRPSIDGLWDSPCSRSTSRARPAHVREPRPSDLPDGDSRHTPRGNGVVQPLSGTSLPGRRLAELPWRPPEGSRSVRVVWCCSSTAPRTGRSRREGPSSSRPRTLRRPEARA